MRRVATLAAIVTLLAGCPNNWDQVTRDGAPPSDTSSEAADTTIDTPSAIDVADASDGADALDARDALDGTDSIDVADAADAPDSVDAPVVLDIVDTTDAADSGCPPMKTSCNGVCVALDSDINNCGSCGHACALDHAVATCTTGACAVQSCSPGFGDCDHLPADGCEIDLSASLANCGACGASCTGGANQQAICGAGACTTPCTQGWGDCDGLSSTGCETPLDTTANCGACGAACTASGAVCDATSETCMGGCPSGEMNCSGTCAMLSSDPNHCGTCANQCSLSNATPVCNAGSCAIGACNSGFGDCDNVASNGCESALDTTTHCGSCGASCTFMNGSGVCNGGTCVYTGCASGFDLCSGACFAATDTAHCGPGCTACPMPSNGTATCDGTACSFTCGSGYHACTLAGICALDTDPANCGTPCQTCAAPPSTHGSAACVASNCTLQCDTGYENCGADCLLATSIVGVFPSQGAAELDNSIDVFGTGFAAGDSVILEGATISGGMSADLTLTNVTIVDSTHLRATVPTGATQGGPYVIDVRGAPGTCPATKANAYTVVSIATSGVTITSISPTAGPADGSVHMNISGTGFLPGARAWLKAGGTIFPLSTPVFVNSSLLQANVIMGPPLGATLDLEVVNPDGTGALYTNAFLVTSAGPPVVTSVSPTSWVAGTGQTITFNGSGFVSPTVTFTNGAGVTLGTCTGTIVGGGFTCSVTITSAGSVVPHVKNSDGQTADGPTLTLVGSSPGPVAALNMVAPLGTPRRGAGAVVSHSDALHEFVYAIGGEDQSNTVLSSVEMTPIDSFGHTGMWTQVSQGLATPTGEIAESVVERNGYIYVFGGLAGGFPTRAIQRTRVLQSSGAPTIAPPSATDGAGSLVGYYIYVVSANLDGTDPDNPNGETLPSREIPVLSFQPAGVSLSWSALPHAASYNVYRTYRGGGTGTEHRLATGITSTSYVDDGSVAPQASVSPVPAGSTGPWTALTALLQTARTSGGAAIDPTRSTVFVAGGHSGASVLMNDECLGLSADGATLTAATGLGVGLAETHDSPSVQFATASNVPGLIGETVIVAGGPNPKLDYTAGGPCSSTMTSIGGSGLTFGAGMLLAGCSYMVGGWNGVALQTSGNCEMVAPSGAPTGSPIGVGAVLVNARQDFGYVFVNGVLLTIGGTLQPTLSGATAEVDAAPF